MKNKKITKKIIQFFFSYPQAPTKIIKPLFKTFLFPLPRDFNFKPNTGIDFPCSHYAAICATPNFSIKI